METSESKKSLIEMEGFAAITTGACGLGEDIINLSLSSASSWNIAGYASSLFINFGFLALAVYLFRQYEQEKAVCGFRYSSFFSLFLLMGLIFRLFTVKDASSNHKNGLILLLILTFVGILLELLLQRTNQKTYSQNYLIPMKIGGWCLFICVIGIILIQALDLLGAAEKTDNEIFAFFFEALSLLASGFYLLINPYLSEIQKA